MALSGLSIVGIILIIIALIMIIIGVVLLIIDTNTSTSWYIWFLIIGGVVLGIIGGILLALGLSEPEVPVQMCPSIPQPTCPPIPQPTCPNIKPVCPSNRCPYANPLPTYTASVPTYTAPVVTPVQQIPVPSPTVTTVPTTYSERVEKLGTDSFDPDPQVSVIETPPQKVRRKVVGPYGPNGENVEVFGTHTIPAQRKIITKDVQEHPVDFSEF